jgi:phage gp46-like protein
MNTKLNPFRISNIPQQTQNQNDLVTSKDIAEERREKMNSKLQNKQEEFNKLISAEKPKEIDFADSAEEKPIGSEMDNLLADMMEKRSKQLNQVMQSQDTNAAEKWINNEGAGAEISSSSANTSGPVTLNIGEKVETPSITVVQTSSETKDKHVTFSEDTKEEESGLDLFQFLSVKNGSSAPFMPPQEENDEVDKKEDIKEARASAWRSARQHVENEILERLSRIEREFIEVKDLLKNM